MIRRFGADLCMLLYADRLRAALAPFSETHDVQMAGPEGTGHCCVRPSRGRAAAFPGLVVDVDSGEDDRGRPLDSTERFGQRRAIAAIQNGCNRGRRR
jgi:hypothetical protein